jgi:methyl-accepting chemotaxis protein
VKALAGETRSATQRIGQMVENLSRAAGGLRLASEAGSRSAQAGAEAALAAAAALGEVVDQVSMVTAEVGGMAEAGRNVGARAVEMGRAIAQQAESGQEAAAELKRAAERGDGLQGQAESLMQLAAASGAQTSDTPFILAVQDAAGRIALAFEAALRAGETTEEALFDENYQPIAGTAPQQVMTRFTELADRLLPPIQEPMLALDARVVFCAAVDRRAYLPTHNRKFSHPQRPGELAWNTANCRNRRIFDDRTGLGAARNRQPFLLQAYRRDMGGGKVALMKDCSAPIMVRGRHWGGLRLAFLAR